MGGAERVTFSLASELALRPGWSVEVVMASSELPNSAARQLLPPQVRIRYGPWKSWYRSFAILPFRLALKRYDLVVTTQIYTNALLSWMRRWKLIRIGRLVARESSSLFDWTAGLKRRLFERLYRVYGQEDLLIAQTRYMAEHVRRVLPSASAERLRVLPNPVNAKAIEAAAAVELDKNLREQIGAAPAILLCGRLIARKNPLLALAVFHQIASRNFRSQLVFVGDGPLETQLREEALRLGILDRILFLGRLKNPFPVMAACQYWPPYLHRRRLSECGPRNDGVRSAQDRRDPLRGRSSRPARCDRHPHVRTRRNRARSRSRHRNARGSKCRIPVRSRVSLSQRLPRFSARGHY